MPDTSTATVLKILEEDFDDVFADWIETQSEEGVKRADLFSEAESKEQTASLLRAFAEGVRTGVSGENFDLDGEGWANVRGVLAEITKERVQRGVKPDEMAEFVLALKAPLFDRLRTRLAKKPDELIDEIYLISRMVDAFALYTNKVFIAEREEVIERQREEMLELSTPVVELWDKILTLPLIGTLDSLRAQEVMENLLEAIVRLQTEVVILDITGVQTVDTQVAQHLLRTASAVRLMGAQCIISGISPKIAQTMVQLGVDVGEVTTRQTIHSALVGALAAVGFEIRRLSDASGQTVD